MGVAKTLPNYKSFTFDGTNSRNYGVYITGQGVFNAPERNVEMVEIPGRNGAYALDKGNFNNIEITYPAGIFADTEADFAQAVSDLRSFLCSKSGYCRLEDDYNSGEYRMAIYKSGLEVDHDMLIAGEFNIVFECKPQRYLTSGETAVAVTSGGKVTNPTLFDARPQLQVWGYGDIDLGGQGINIQNAIYGNVILANSGTSATVDLNMSAMDTGDLFTVSDSLLRFESNSESGYASYFIYNTLTAVNCSIGPTSFDAAGFLKIIPDDITFSKGTADALNFTVDGTFEVGKKNMPHSTYTSYSVTVSGSVAYDGDSTLTFSIGITPSSFTYVLSFSATITTPDIFGNSTKSMLGSPIYIDLDTGEAYNIENGTAVSINNAVTIPAELPTLPPGDTTITYDNTITQFKVLPRWWKV